MGKNLSYLILSLYFFTYLVPQYIPSVLIAYDRAIVQFFYVSLVNILSFIIIFRSKLTIENLVLRFKYKTHIIAYIFFILIAILSIVVAENYVESIFELAQIINSFCFCCHYYF